MTIVEKQQKFAELLARLITELIGRGYGVTMGECWRSPETARVMADEGKGIRDSLHTIRLACDVNLFKGDTYLQTVDDYREAGEIWEGYSTEAYQCCWGGRFERPDSDHFSIEHNSIR